MSEQDAQPTDVAALSFERAQAELEAIVERLEDPHTGLEEALALWERGEALHAHCQAKLDYAAERIAKLTVGPKDTEPADQDVDFVPESSSREQAAAVAEPRIEPQTESFSEARSSAPEAAGDPDELRIL